MNRKQKYKGRDDKSRPMGDQPKDTTMLLGQLTNSNKTVQGVNAIATTTLANDYTLAVQHVALPTVDIVDAVQFLIDPSIQDVINAYSSAKGYTSSVTSSIVRGHLEQIVKAVEALFVLKRSQDGKQMTDIKGHDLDDILFSIPSGGRQFSTTSGGLDPVVNVSVTKLGTGGISNADWASDYLSELYKLTIPYKLFKFLENLYCGVYLNPTSGIDAYYSFWPISTIVGLTAVITPETAFANALSTINTNLATYPDLRTIIGLLGIDASPLVNYDWNRDIKGQSLKVINDPLIDSFFKNEHLSFSAFDEADVPQSIQDTVDLPFIRGGVEGYQDLFEVGYDMLPYLGMFRATTGAPTLLNLSTIKNAGGVQQYTPVPPLRITFTSSVTSLSDDGEQQISDLGTCMNISSYVLPANDQIFLSGSCGDNDCTSFSLSASATTSFNGYNKMRLEETDHDIITKLFFTELMFGSEYRDNLNAIAQKVTANINMG